MVALCTKLYYSFITDFSGGEYQSLQSYQSRTGEVSEIRMILDEKLEIRN